MSDLAVAEKIYQGDFIPAGEIADQIADQINKILDSWERDIDQIGALLTKKRGELKGDREYGQWCCTNFEQRVSRNTLLNWKRKSAVFGNRLDEVEGISNSILYRLSEPEVEPYREDFLQWVKDEEPTYSEFSAEAKKRKIIKISDKTVIESLNDEPLPDGVSVILGDAIEELKKLQSGSIDLIATDPPYNMDKADWDSYGSGEEFAAWCEQWLIECQRVLKPHGSIYIFGINRMLSHLQRWLDENMVYRNWIMWDTIQGAGGGLWTNRHEAILYYSKTDETYEDKDSVKLERHEEHVREYKGKEYKFKNPSNIWRFPCVDNKHEDRTAHITQKPVEIMQRIIKANTPVSGIVCDPFTGSGTSAVAAVRESRRFIGFEIDESHHAIAMKRVSNEISD